MLESPDSRTGFDRTNAVIAALVFIFTFIIYALTVQRTIPFWDCGEFIASAAILGVPHPPGTPLFVMLGRIASIIPFVEDVAYRVNYLSVISSALTAMFSYLLTVRLVQYFFYGERGELSNRIISYVGGICGGLLVAFGNTNWANSVEAEVYGLALSLIVGIVWLGLKYYEARGTAAGGRYLVLIMYLAMLGIGVHLTVYAVIPVVSIFFVLKKDATKREYLAICLFALMELMLIIVFANGRGGENAFKVVSVVLGLVLLVMIWRKVSWGLLVALAACSTVMISFSLYRYALPASIIVLILMGVVGRKFGWKLQWKIALAVVLAGFIGLSVHFFIPIRSTLNPRIDENNASRGWPGDWRTFINFLDRKQYGQESMVDRMFERRGTWENQFGRHPHMGYWSYFEEQFSSPGWGFVPFFLLGLIGMGVAIKKRLEIGLPFFTLFILMSAGLVLYMNFADGTKFSFETGDAYLEVRDRDYFFTPAFVFFGIAMGMGVTAVMQWLKNRLAASNPGLQTTIAYASVVLVLLPSVALSRNFHTNDRSQNHLPYWYARNLLDSCEENAILFTSGDNDTFPVWCLQEAFNYRKDIRVVNLSLLNTDWYVEQMKTRYDVPISLSIDQIRWYPVAVRGGIEYQRPKEPFHDRPRKRMEYMQANLWNNQQVRVAEMMTDEIILENKFEVPIYFSSAPYESPLKLRERCMQVGQIYRLQRDFVDSVVDMEKSWHLYMDVYRFDGYESSKVYRDENATGVALGVGLNSLRLYDELLRRGDTTRAVELMDHLINVYPEYWQPYMNLVELYTRQGDSLAVDGLLQQYHDTMDAFVASNPNNFYYMQDLGLAKIELGRSHEDQSLIDDGIDLMTQAFHMNMNAGYSFRKLATVLVMENRRDELIDAIRKYSMYRQNLSDPFLRQLMGYASPDGGPPRPGNQ